MTRHLKPEELGLCKEVVVEIFNDGDIENNMHVLGLQADPIWSLLHACARGDEHEVRSITERLSPRTRGSLCFRLRYESSDVGPEQSDTYVRGDAVGLLLEYSQQADLRCLNYKVGTDTFTAVSLLGGAVDALLAKLPVEERTKCLIQRRRSGRDGIINETDDEIKPTWGPFAQAFPMLYLVGQNNFPVTGYGVRAVGENGECALHVVAEHAESIECITYFMRQGYSSGRTDRDGLTPLDYLKRNEGFPEEERELAMTVLSPRAVMECLLDEGMSSEGLELI